MPTAGLHYGSYYLIVRNLLLLIDYGNDQYVQFEGYGELLVAFLD